MSGPSPRRSRRSAFRFLSRIAFCPSFANMSAPPRSSPTRICPGSSPQVVGNVNAVYAITYSACFYVLRCLLGPDAPATAGLMYPVEVLAPQGSVVNAEPPAAVAGGNVETSQRAYCRCVVEGPCASRPTKSPGGQLRNDEQFNDFRREFACLQAGDERREVYPQLIDLHALFSAIRISVNHLGSTH
jgi:hypothetical protein